MICSTVPIMKSKTVHRFVSLIVAISHLCCLQVFAEGPHPSIDPSKQTQEPQEIEKTNIPADTELQALIDEIASRPPSERLEILKQALAEQEVIEKTIGEHDISGLTNPDNVRFTEAFPDPLEENALKFHFVIPTTRQHFDPHHSGVFPMEFRSLAFDNMKEGLKVTHQHGLLPQYSSQHPPELIIYLPSRKVLKRVKARLAQSAIAQFQEVFPEVRPKIRFRVSTANVFDFNQVSTLITRLMTVFRKSFPNDPQVKEFTESVAQRVAQETEETKEQLAQHEFDPFLDNDPFSAPKTEALKSRMATIRTVILAATRATQVWAATDAGTLPIVSAIAVFVVDPAVEYYTVRHVLRVQNAIESLGKKFGLYSQESPLRDKVAKFVSRLVFNLGVMSIARPMVMQTLLHESGADVPLPTAQQIKDQGLWTCVGAVCYGAFQTGYNTLRQKGWVSNSQVEYMLQVSGGFDTAINILSSWPAFRPALHLLWLTQWLGLFVPVAVIARLAPIKVNRIVAIEDTIMNWDRIKAETNTDESRWVTQENIAKVVAEALSSPSIKTAVSFNCRDFLQKKWNKLVTYARDLFK